MTSSSSVVARIEAATDSSAAITFLGSAGRDGRERVSWRELHDDARAVAAALQARGVGPGVQVALLGPTTRPIVTAIQAVWLAGGTLVCLPLPMRLGSIEEFAQQTRRRIKNAHASLVVVDPDLEPFLALEPGGEWPGQSPPDETPLAASTNGGGEWPGQSPPDETPLAASTNGGGDPPVVRLDELRGDASAWERPDDDPDRLAIVQFTSGSTDDPKGVILPHHCLVQNIDAIVEGAGLGGDDVGVSWLPLYHDMGLIGLLMTPMLTGFELGLAPPQDFLAAPGDWMCWMSEQRATVTGGPNFAYALAARALRRLDGLDLSAWRLALNGAEPIDPTSVEEFLESGARHGLDSKAAFCVYGMAEATLAISFPQPGTGLTVDVIDPVALEHERYAAPANVSGETRRLALLGRTLRGLELRVCDPDTGAPCRDREVGEFELRGSSVTPGYFARPELTTESFRDGWLRTGDLGYLVDGEVVVCGRIKDVIIVGGRNVFPEEIERAAASVDGVRAGNVIAFGTPGRRGKEGIVVVAETREDELARLHDDVTARVCDTVGIPPFEVIFVQAGSLPKTSSGKLQRSACKTQYHADRLTRA